MTFKLMGYIYNKNMIIYLTTHTPTGKKYIGKDKANNPHYYGSGVNIKKIIQDEGITNLKKETLEECHNQEHLVEREIYWLEKFDVENNPLFLNKTNKAYGNSKQTDEGKSKISKALKGKKQSEDVKKKKSNSLKKFWSSLSEEERKKRGQQTKNKRIKNGGYKHNEKTKEKMGKSKKGNTNRRKTVFQFTLQEEYIQSFPSVLEAAYSLNKPTGAAITEACSGKRKSIYGFLWKYQK